MQSANLKIYFWLGISGPSHVIYSRFLASITWITVSGVGKKRELKDFKLEQETLTVRRRWWIPRSTISMTLRWELENRVSATSDYSAPKSKFPTKEIPTIYYVTISDHPFHAHRSKTKISKTESLRENQWPPVANSPLRFLHREISAINICWGPNVPDIGEPKPWQFSH